MEVDFKISPATKHKSYEIDFDSLNQAQVEKQISLDVEHISGIFGVEVCKPDHVFSGSH